MHEDATPDATPDPSHLQPVPGKRPKQRGKAPPRQEKPWADFPLTWHARGYWCKKIDGQQVRYTQDWKESYDLWRADDEARTKGAAVPSLAVGSYTCEDAASAFMDRQQERFEDGQISDVQLGKYRLECEQFLKSVGPQVRLRRLCGEDAPSTFRKIKQAAVARGLVVAERHVAYVRKVLELANRRGIMPPPNYQDSFDPPTPEQLARWKNEEEAQHGERAWSVAELRAIVAGAMDWSPHLFAQVLLALNTGFGADDCGLLRDHMIDRDRMLIRAFRGKTMRKRIAPLWPVTLAAIDVSRGLRAAPKDPAHADRVFLTENGLVVARKTRSLDDDDRVRRTGRVDAIRLAFDDMLAALQADADGTSLARRLRKLVAEGFLDASRRAAEVAQELGRRGRVARARTVARELNLLVDAGVLQARGPRFGPERTFHAVEGAPEREAEAIAAARGKPKPKFVRHKAGFYTLRAMFRSLAVGCNVDKDLIAVIKGQRFERAVDEYYLRGDLRAKLFDVVDHVYRELFVGWSSPQALPPSPTLFDAPAKTSRSSRDASDDASGETTSPRRRARRDPQ